MAEGTASILLVDDHAVIAAAMAVALRDRGFDPVEAADAEDLSPEAVLGTARRLKPDIVLLDLHLGGHLGLPLIRPLVELGSKVLLFTAGGSPALIGGSLRAGAEAVVDKSMAFDKVVAILMDVAAGRKLLLDDEREALVETLLRASLEEQQRRRPFERLTEREAEVLRRLVAGDSPKQIAHSGGTSVSTVRGHIERVFQKLGVSSQREALARARAAGWPGN